MHQKIGNVEHIYVQGAKVPETLLSKRVEAYDLVDSPSAIASACRVPLTSEATERSISLYIGSLKQLVPVSSNLWHRSSVRLTNAKAACLAILLLELFPPVAFGPQQAYQKDHLNSFTIHTSQLSRDSSRSI